MFLRGILLGTLLSVQVFAKGPTTMSTFSSDHKSLQVPTLTSFSKEEFKQISLKWTAGARKMASEMNFSEADLSSDFVKLRTDWLKVETADDLATLLEVSYQKFKTYSPDVQYFLAQMHVMRPLRGIVWRLRPLFEEGGRYSGNKTTHVTAIQFVRTVATGLDAAFPHFQMDAMIEYFTMPSKEMSENFQFKNMYSFQKFLVDTYLPALITAASRIETVLSKNPTAVWKWDNKMFYGTGAFSDGINRIVGHGAAEMYSAYAFVSSAIHDVLVFSAYNQDSLIEVIGNTGKAMGIDSMRFNRSNIDVGLTDQERTSIVKQAIVKNRFLQIRDYDKTKYGTGLMSWAYIAKKNAAEGFNEAYRLLKDRPANSSMAINPGIFNREIQNRLGQGVKNMLAVVSGEAEVRDPISGQKVTLNVPRFYSNPPSSLGVLMASGWETGTTEKTITNTKGDKLIARNYFHGRANAWNNKAWEAYVPSAAGKAPGYMLEAKRVMHYSLGTAPVFGVVDMFIR